jgi:hypothetical protein
MAFRLVRFELPEFHAFGNVGFRVQREEALTYNKDRGFNGFCTLRE